MPGITNVNIGVPTYVTATGYSCITSAAAVLYGVLVHGTATCGFQLFSSNTATASTAITGSVWAYGTTGATVNQGVFFDTPAQLPAGFCIRNLPALDPKLTLFWAPAGTT